MPRIMLNGEEANTNPETKYVHAEGWGDPKLSHVTITEEEVMCHFKNGTSIPSPSISPAIARAIIRDGIWIPQA